MSTSQDFRQVYSFNFTVSSFRLDRTYSTCKFKSLRIEMDSISTMKDNFRNDKVESLKFLFSNLARTKCIRTYSLYVIFEILIKQRSVYAHTELITRRVHSSYRYVVCMLSQIHRTLKALNIFEHH